VLRELYSVTQLSDFPISCFAILTLNFIYPLDFDFVLIPNSRALYLPLLSFTPPLHPLPQAPARAASFRAEHRRRGTRCSRHRLSAHGPRVLARQRP
jgi:hypothetical protein